METNDNNFCPSENDKYEKFLNLFRTNEDRIFGFILTFLPNFSKAEDVFQDTMLVMWRKFDDYQEGTNFAAWGNKIARYNLYKYYKKNSSDIIQFNSEALEKLSCQALESPPIDVNAWQEALVQCLEKLENTSKLVIRMRYEENLHVKDIAIRLGQTVRSTYRILSRIQQVLHHCVGNTINGWEKP